MRYCSSLKYTLYAAAYSFKMLHMFLSMYFNGQGDEGVRGPWGKWGNHGGGVEGGPGPPGGE
jgi:hypothetical protein